MVLCLAIFSKDRLIVGPHVSGLWFFGGMTIDQNLGSLGASKGLIQHQASPIYQPENEAWNN